jgi:hypothetical protein
VTPFVFPPITVRPEEFVSEPTVSRMSCWSGPASG